MLDDIKKQQLNVCKQIERILNSNTVSHAYLIDTNNYQYKNEIVLEFVKSLLCKNHTFLKECHSSICDRIEKNMYSEFKMIEPDGMWIKKEQLLELQKEFKYKSIESSRKVYVIKNAERMNASAANTILKFLEEPEENIIAILVSDNIHQLLDTIVSRCQIITLANQDNETSIVNKIKKYVVMSDDELEQTIADTLDFIYFLEQKKLDAIIYMKEFVNKFTDRTKLETVFEIMIFFYKDLLNVKLNNKNEFFEENDLNELIELNNIEQIKEKIFKLIECKKNLKINANINLLLDKFIIDIGSDVCGQDSWCNI